MQMMNDDGLRRRRKKRGRNRLSSAALSALAPNAVTATLFTAVDIMADADDVGARQIVLVNRVTGQLD